MACRPAGMSDESDSEDDSYFINEKPNKRSSNKWSTQNGNGSPVVAKVVPSQENRNRQEEQELQFRALSACMTGNLSIIDEYLNAGHNVNDYLYTGWTLLLYGASAMLPEVVEYLIKRGAKPNKNKGLGLIHTFVPLDGYTPLMAVCDCIKGSYENCLRCIKILIEAKANPNARNKTMKTPLMFACKSREAVVVAELLKHVKDIDSTDSDGRTALHNAAISNKLDTVKILLKNNASRAIRDQNDMTARDIANTKGFDKIVALLDFEENCDIEDICETTRRDVWIDLFPALCGDRNELLNTDVAEMLYGMGLESYRPLFKGMELNTFLKLTDEDLVKLGIDIAMHRKQFKENLHKFHTKAWSIRSIGSIKKYLPYTLYDGVALLGNAARQIGVIGSSFEFIKNGLRKSNEKGASLSEVQKAEYSEELKKTEQTLMLLKKDLRHVMNLAKKVERENRGMVPAAHIGPDKKKYNFTIILSVMLMTGMYLSKTSYVQRLWNN